MSKSRVEPGPRLLLRRRRGVFPGRVFPGRVFPVNKSGPMLLLRCRHLGQPEGSLPEGVDPPCGDVDWLFWPLAPCSARCSTSRWESTS